MMIDTFSQWEEIRWLKSGTPKMALVHIAWRMLIKVYHILRLLIVLETITVLRLSSENRYLVTGSEDTTIKLWDMKEMESLHHFEDAHGGKMKFSHFIKRNCQRDHYNKRQKELFVGQ
jgi:WD40 repeat protein